MGKEMAKRDWANSVRRKLPDDTGDCPTLPQEMLDALTSLRSEKGESAWSGRALNLK
jgi:hypothetical protein